MTYDFNTQHNQGKQAEYFIYDLFQTAFNVIPAPGWLQQQGVDFTFTDRVTNQTWKVELKTDSRAHRSGNAFIETISVDRDGKLGWAYTSIADWLLYFLPRSPSHPPRIYRIAFDVLRLELPAWEAYPTRTIPNKGRGGDYNTIGLLIPLAELQRIAQEVIEW